MEVSVKKNEVFGEYDVIATMKDEKEIVVGKFGHKKDAMDCESVVNVLDRYLDEYEAIGAAQEIMYELEPSKESEPWC